MTIIFAYTSKLPTRLYCSEIAQNKKAINTTQKGVFIAFLEKQGHSLTTNKPLYKNKRCFYFL